MREKIEKALKELTELTNWNLAIKDAKSWLKTGSLYSNHDFDVLNHLTLEINIARGKI